MTLASGTQLGPYEIVELLGAGGMGEVYRARDPRLGRDVAVKVLPEEVAGDTQRLSFFEREARAVAALNHPNILTVHDVGTHDGTPYVVTELLEGENLRELTSRRSPTARQVLGYGVQAAKGLEAAHAKGIVHRDLKPENLFLTTDGRVKVLDFGLAKLVRRENVATEVSTPSRSTTPGQIVGTVAYMSPEQARGLPVDPRSDVFSFGVVLYELLSGQHPFRRESAVATLTAIVEDTPADLESLGRGIQPAVGGIVRRCLEKSKGDRYGSGHDVVVALEAVLAAPTEAAALLEVEERSPYPGLRSFTEKDAGFFFGRENEVKALWGRLEQRKLLAVIGPSGAGKTSFVRAGVLPARPEGWAAIVATPGASPFRGLAQALVAELAGDAEALRQLLSFDDPAVAVSIVARWRQTQGEALLVMDQFEELFTLNPPEVQQRFAEFLGRLVVEADVHVLLSLRDDFLIRCCEQKVFAPVLRELTALLPLERDDLRRALTEPAGKRGYRFDDEELVEEVTQAVEGARAALPLLAFAVARLWEKRDREKKLLTREAYEEIGGVAGALAQHAEETLDRIGVERQGIVREIFRNLVTSQGTRSVTQREELLSVFPDPQAAAEVLDALIDSRLLTSYQVPDTETGGRAEGPEARERHRIEVVHESLLKAWPRLVRWQAQDEEGALLRDQLKQAAHLWEEKSRSPDLLWSGTAFQEFELWRERYPGKLTTLEDEFSRAMVERDRRRRRWRQITVSGVVAASLGVAAIVWVSREQAVRHARRADHQARLAEAANLVTLARLELDRYPTAALAYARRSLEVADTPAGRRLALEALWRGPLARLLVPRERFPAYWKLAFSADGEWLATSGVIEDIRLFRRDGSVGPVISGLRNTGGPRRVLFDRTQPLLATHSGGDPSVRIFSVPDGREVRQLDTGLRTSVLALDEELLTGTFSASSQPEILFRRWRLDGDEPRDLGTLAVDGLCGLDVDRKGRRLAYGRAQEVYVRDLSDPSEPDRAIGHHTEPLIAWQQLLDCVELSPRGDKLASVGESREIHVWSLTAADSGPERILRGMGKPEDNSPLVFDPAGSRLAWGSTDELSIYLWDVDAPRDARPRTLKWPDAPGLRASGFDPGGTWLAVSSGAAIAFWPVEDARSHELPGHAQGPIERLVFTANGAWLASCAHDGVRLWPTTPRGASGHPDDWILRDNPCYSLASDPSGPRLLYGGSSGPVLVVPVAEGAVRELMRDTWGGEQAATSGGLTFDADGARAAWAAGWAPKPEAKVLRVWDLDSGDERVFPLCDGFDCSLARDRGIEALRFAPDGLLFSAGSGGVLKWNIETGSRETILESEQARIDLSRDGTHLVIASGALSESGFRADDLSHLDLRGGATRRILTHGDGVSSLAIDTAGKILATGSADGVVRVGPLSGEEPHLLLGHESPITALAISPDGRWIASASGTEIRLWPTPDVTTPPLHTAPYDELLAKLQAVTNLRVLENEASSTGYTLELGPFPGWKEVPTW